MSIDRDSLLQPIKPDAPSGPSLHYEPLYDQIKEARREDDALAPQGIWQTTLKTANWRKVVDLCADGLKKSKDIQLVAWMTDALCQTDGYEGLAEGLDLLDKLSQGFWETLWPEPDDVESGDYESRVIVYEWLQRQLMRRLPFVTLTDPASRTEDPYDLLVWRKVGDLPVDPNAPDEGDAPTPKRFQASLAATPTEVLADTRRAAAASAKSLSDLEAFLDQHCKTQSPSFRELNNLLAEVVRRLDGVLAERAPAPAPEPEPEPEPEPVAEAAAPSDWVPVSPSAPPAPAPTAAAPSLTPKTRDHAYAMLAAVADYLGRTDPHSPVPYLLKRAVSFREMTFADLLGHLVDDERQRSHLLKLMGLPQQGQG